MIETSNLSKQFGDFQAVQGLNLRVREGEVLALLGPNGAGKTTTVRMLSSVLRPSQGWARVAGWDVSVHPRRVRQSVGVLTEQHGLYERMSARDYLLFFGGIYGLSPAEASRRAEELLAYFGLQNFSDQNMATFSKGMRQKLSLARALLHNPPVLLLDEPTSAMDPESAQLVRDEILQLRSENRAIVLCTHNLNEAEMLADRIAIIEQGRILLSGTVDELKLSLLGPPEYELTLSATWQTETWPFGVQPLSVSPRRLRLHIPEPEENNPRLLNWLLARQAPVLTLREVPQTLEEVYLTALRNKDKMAHE